ncbi:MAG: AraC family ligand binding domain-containing protein [Erysipelotrichaceae bacterium]
MKYFNSNDNITYTHYDEISQFIQLIDFKINSIGVWYSDRNKKANYTIKDIEIILYTKGGGITSVNNHVHNLKVGDVLILKPNLLYTSINENADEYEYQFIHFDIEPKIYQQQFLDLLTNTGHSVKGFTNKKIEYIIHSMVDEDRQKNLVTLLF